MQYDAVIFDLFGTLIDWRDDDEYERVQREIAEVLSVPGDDFLRVWRDIRPGRDTGVFGGLEGDMSNVCRILGSSATSEEIDRAVQLRLDVFRRRIEVRPDAVSTLSELKSMGMKTGLISVCGDEIPRLWGELPLGEYMDDAIFSSNIGLLKPDHRLYWLAAQDLAVMMDRCLYVGDGAYRELTGAKRMGMSPVLIRVDDNIEYGEEMEDAVEWTGPCVSSLTEILSIVR